MKLLIARHGQSEAQVGFDNGDPRLTATGREQVRLLGESLRFTKIDRIYASHLSRAVETAAAVARAQDRDLPIVVLPTLAECGTRPDWEQSPETLRAIYPNLILSDLRIGDGFADNAERAEAAVQACAFTPAFEEGFTLCEPTGEGERCENELTVLVAAHAMFNACLLRALTGLTLDKGHVVSQYNACLNRFELFEIGGVRRVKFRTMNEVTHLPADLLT